MSYVFCLSGDLASSSSSSPWLPSPFSVPRCAKCERPDSAARYHGIRCQNNNSNSNSSRGSAAVVPSASSSSSLEVSRLRAEAAATAAELDRARQHIANLRLEKERSGGGKKLYPYFFLERRKSLFLVQLVGRKWCAT